MKKGLKTFLSSLTVGVVAFFAATVQAQTPPTGIYVSSSRTGYNSSGELTHSVLQADVTRDFVKGVLVRVNWSDLEPTQGNRDWTLLDNELDLADAYGTKVTLAVVNGPDAPAWLEAAGAQTFTYTFRGTPNVKMPVPWDSIYLNAWTDFISALGQRYRDRSTISLVRMTHSTYNGFEMQLALDRSANPGWTDAGYTDERAISSWKTVLDAFAAAFPSKPLDVDVHSVLPDENLSDSNGSVAANVVNYGNSTIGTRFGVFAGWWSQNNAISGYPEMFDLIKQAAVSSFATVQMCASAYSDPDKLTGITGSNPVDALTGAIDLALNNGVRYIEIWNADIRATEFQQLLSDTAARIANAAPLAQDQAVTINEDQPVAITLNGTDKDNNPLTYSITSQPSRGLLSGTLPVVTYTPDVNYYGSDQFTFKVDDGRGGTGSGTVSITINSVNNVPAISAIAAQTITSAVTIPFTVTDVETPVDLLAVTASSGNTDLVPNGNIVLSGVLGSWTAKVTPAANKSGTTTINLTVTDGNGGSATSSFNLTVNTVNDAPTISNIADQAIRKNTSTGDLAFTIGDLQTSASLLTVTAGSGNTTLVPKSKITFSGTGATRTVKVTPALNKTGTAVITVTVSDGLLTKSDSFNLKVK